MKPTVGRIVHFYNTQLADHVHNGIGKGPYAAIVTQTFNAGQYSNLKCFPGFSPPWDEGSVEECKEMTTDSGGKVVLTRYWKWPPRE